jgi:hypothetical protein
MRYVGLKPALAKPNFGRNARSRETGTMACLPRNASARAILARQQDELIDAKIESCGALQRAAGARACAPEDCENRNARTL